MNWEAIDAVAQIVGVIVVVITLILGAAVAVHYALFYDRIIWLLSRSHSRRWALGRPDRTWQP